MYTHASLICGGRTRWMSNMQQWPAAGNIPARGGSATSKSTKIYQRTTRFGARDVVLCCVAVLAHCAQRVIIMRFGTNCQQATYRPTLYSRSPTVCISHFTRSRLSTCFVVVGVVDIFERCAPTFLTFTSASIRFMHSRWEDYRLMMYYNLFY